MTLEKLVQKINKKGYSVEVVFNTNNTIVLKLHKYELYDGTHNSSLTNSFAIMNLKQLKQILKRLGE